MLHDQQVAKHFADVLRRAEVGIDDDFFALGGHDLLFARAMAVLLRESGADLPLPLLRSQPTPRAIADLLRGYAQHGRAGAEAVADARLPVDLPAVLPAAVRPGRPDRVLLTGATGYLGGHLLDALLRLPVTAVHCVVRAPDRATAQQRIDDGRSFRGLADRTGRVLAEPGDLRRPLVGLSAARFAELAATVDTIYHVGAEVNFVHPYAALRATNVDSTRELVRLAASGPGAALHFVSTVSPVPGRAAVTEDEPLPLPEHASGYLRSKFVAEQVVRAAGARGLQVTTYRPTLTLGHTVTGAVSANEFACLLVKACVQVGAVPDEDAPFTFMPVDYVSNAILALSTRPTVAGRCYHLVNPAPARLSQVWQWLRDYGYPLRTLPGHGWLARVREAGPGNALHPVVPLLTDGLAGLAAPAQGVDSTNTDKELAGTAVRCPPVSRDLVWLILDYLTRIGFLPPPPGSRNP